MNMQNKQSGFTGMLIAIIVAVILVGAGVIYIASTKTSQPSPVVGTEKPGMEASSTEKAMMGPSVVLKGGKFMLDDNGKSSTLTVDYMFPDGTKVSLKGIVTKKDGTTATLKEGESVWPGGSIIKAGEMMTSAGSYEEYDQSKISRAENGKVVLFFRALWCPTCVGLDNNIKAHLKDIPKDVTILYVDYDHSDALKQKYRVTIQHTLVEVDAKGNQIKQWKGSPTLDSLVAEIQ